MKDEYKSLENQVKLFRSIHPEKTLNGLNEHLTEKITEFQMLEQTIRNTERELEADIPEELFTNRKPLVNLERKISDAQKKLSDAQKEAARKGKGGQYPDIIKHEAQFADITAALFLKQRLSANPHVAGFTEQEFQDTVEEIKSYEPFRRTLSRPASEIIPHALNGVGLKFYEDVVEAKQLAPEEKQPVKQQNQPVAEKKEEKQAVQNNQNDKQHTNPKELGGGKKK